MASTHRQDANGDSWVEYRRLVLAELERLDTNIIKLAQANLDQEKSISDAYTSHKSELIEKLHALENRHNDLRLDIATKSSADIDELRDRIKLLEELNNKLNSEVRIIKEKAAFFGFLAGLFIAMASLIVRIWWK